MSIFQDLTLRCSIAGASLAGASGVIDKQFREDRGQLKVGLDRQAAGIPTIPYGGNQNYPIGKYIAEKRAEIEDDHAGVTVGYILSQKIDGKLSFTNARAQITDLLCK